MLGYSGGEISTLQIYISHVLKSPQWAMNPVQRMRRAFATTEEVLRTMAEERKLSHLADEFFTSTGTKAFRMEDEPQSGRGFDL